MRNLIIICLLMISVISCKKDCLSNIEESSAFYKNYENNYHCAFVERPFEFVFKSYDDFLANSNQTTGCSWDNPVATTLDFNGIILCYGVNTKYYNNEQKIDIQIDNCEQKIYYKMTIIQQDTLNIEGYYESVITVIDSIPHDYIIEFSHEIIPYKE